MKSQATLLLFFISLFVSCKSRFSTSGGAIGDPATFLKRAVDAYQGPVIYSAGSGWNEAPMMSADGRYKKKLPDSIRVDNEDINVYWTLSSYRWSHPAFDSINQELIYPNFREDGSIDLSLRANFSWNGYSETKTYNFTLRSDISLRERLRSLAASISVSWDDLNNRTFPDAYLNLPRGGAGFNYAWTLVADRNAPPNQNVVSYADLDRTQWGAGSHVVRANNRLQEHSLPDTVRALLQVTVTSTSNRMVPGSVKTFSIRFRVADRFRILAPGGQAPAAAWQAPAAAAAPIAVTRANFDEAVNQLNLDQYLQISLYDTAHPVHLPGRASNGLEVVWYIEDVDGMVQVNYAVHGDYYTLSSPYTTVDFLPSLEVNLCLRAKNNYLRRHCFSTMLFFKAPQGNGDAPLEPETLEAVANSLTFSYHEPYDNQSVVLTRLIPSASFDLPTVYRRNGVDYQVQWESSDKDKLNIQEGRALNGSGDRAVVKSSKELENPYHPQETFHLTGTFTDPRADAEGNRPTYVRRLDVNISPLGLYYPLLERERAKYDLCYIPGAFDYIDPQAPEDRKKDYADIIDMNRQAMPVEIGEGKLFPNPVIHGAMEYCLNNVKGIESAFSGKETLFKRDFLTSRYPGSLGRFNDNTTPNRIHPSRPFRDYILWKRVNPKGRISPGIGAGIDAGGLRKDFFSNELIKGILGGVETDFKAFKNIRLTEVASPVYAVPPRKPGDDYAQCLATDYAGDTKSEVAEKECYKNIGRLFAWLATSERMPIPLQLSTYTMERMIGNNPLTDEIEGTEEQKAVTLYQRLLGMALFDLGLNDIRNALGGSRLDSTYDPDDEDDIERFGLLRSQRTKTKTMNAILSVELNSGLTVDDSALSRYRVANEFLKFRLNIPNSFQHGTDAAAAAAAAFSGVEQRLQALHEGFHEVFNLSVTPAGARNSVAGLAPQAVKDQFHLSSHEFNKLFFSAELDLNQLRDLLLNVRQGYNLSLLLFNLFKDAVRDIANSEKIESEAESKFQSEQRKEGAEARGLKKEFFVEQVKEEKRKTLEGLLYAMTGSRSKPLDLTLHPLTLRGTTGRMPHAHTCFNWLDMPSRLQVGRDDPVPLTTLKQMVDLLTLLASEGGGYNGA